MNRSACFFLLLSLLPAGPAPAQEPLPLGPVWSEIQAKNWEGAERELGQAEKKGLCKEPQCLAIRVVILDGAGQGTRAVESARRALALSGPDSGLNAGLCNDLGAILYRRAQGDREILKLAETAFRQADSLYRGSASNIRFNLATVLRDLGRGDEAKEIQKELEAAGMLVDPRMAILGDFQHAAPQ